MSTHEVGISDFFFGRKIVKWRILFSKWRKLGVFWVFKSPNFEKNPKKSNKILQMQHYILLGCQKYRMRQEIYFQFFLIAKSG
jgi:hypothetical protein